MMVKVCGITNRADAVAAAEAGASAIGFVFYPRSPRYIAPAKAAEIGADLVLWKVGVFVGLPADEIAAVAREAGLDVVQIYGDAEPAGLRVWRAHRVDASFGPARAGSGEAVLLDSAASGVPFRWSMARDVPGRVIIAGGLDPSNVGEAIREARPWGVDASSRLESSPGIKDHQKVREFVKAALL